MLVRIPRETEALTLIADRYTLLREIGRGGMGAVWLARDELLGREVAVKRIGMPGGQSADLERAGREARLAARLNHPHVVAVFDLVTEGDERWLVMEYIDGVTLATLVQRDGALTPAQLSPLVRQAADALAAAHSAGIVHRDVKPSNILVTEDGQVKLSDFGIARAEADATLTQTGLVTGSPAYLAPEVASGDVATDASDVWSLGATLFHALSGRPPYDVTDNLMGALYRIVNEDPPRLANAGWLAPLLDATMTKEPAERWSMDRVREFVTLGPTGTVVHPVPPSVAETSDPTRTAVLPQAVSPVAPRPTESPTETSPESRRRIPPAPILVAAVIALLIGVIVWAALSTRDPGGGSAAEPQGRNGSPSQKQTSQEPAAPTAEDMQAFIEDYVATASSDPESAFTMLTPEFQEQSGGLEGYLDFWQGQVDTAKLRGPVSADPETLTVAYEIEYTLIGEDDDKGPKSKSTDQVSLALSFDNGVYKIADEN